MLHPTAALNRPNSGLVKGQITYIPEPKKCDLCPEVATYDARTQNGPWANMCDDHFVTLGVGIGYGYGQRLVVGEPPKKDQRAEVMAALASGDLDAIEDAIGDGDIAEWL